MKRWRPLIVLAVGLVAIMALMWALQRRLIYYPVQDLPEPERLGVQVEELALETSDGLTLSAWFLPVDQPRATVAVFNGNGGNRAGRVPLGEALRERGFSVLLVDYRGYGGNPGQPSEAGLAADARAAHDHLVSRPDVRADRLVYFGESLGAGVAVGLATEHPPAALVLRSPFTSLADIAAFHYPLVPASLLLRDRYPNLDRIPGVDVPVMVVAGSADGIVPTEQSRAVYEAASEPKRLLIVDGAGHNDYALLAGAEMIDAVDAFLGDTLGAGE